MDRRSRVWESRLATVPNALSMARLALLGGFLAALFAANDRWLAVALLAVAGATDFADGYVARRFDQVSEIGKVLDPTVDRMVLSAAVLASVVYGAVPVWLAAVVFAREAVVSLATLALAISRAPRIDVIYLGKAGTFGLMACFPLLLGGHGGGAVAHGCHVAGWVLVWPSLAASWAAAFAYLPKARRALAHRGRTPPPPGSPIASMRAGTS